MDERLWYRGDPVPTAPKLSPREGELHVRMRKECAFFLRLSAVTGLAFALCFARCPGFGLNAVVYALCWTLCARLAARRLGLEKRRHRFWYGGILLLSLTVFWTADGFLQAVSLLFCLALQVFWALDLFADVGRWHFGKAFSAAFFLFARTLGRVTEPFAHWAALRRSAGSRGKGKYVLLGLLIALPLSAVVIALLLSADAAFRALGGRFFSAWDPDRLAVWLHWGMCFLAGSLLFYGVLAAQTDKPEPEGEMPAARAETVVALTFTGVLTLIYLVFCAVQLRMLFYTDGSGLPEGYTYAEYAREGFFQLLAVSALNVLVVIVSERRFAVDRRLRAMLTVLSGCTFALILSSGRRMLLYIRVYHLTVLRLLVLWFLVVLALILLGAVLAVYRPDFRLCRYTLLVCLIGWLVFAFARPDALAARYDLARIRDERNMSNTCAALLSDFSADAVAELRPYLGNMGNRSKWMDTYLEATIPTRYQSFGWRCFNYSLWQANRTAEEYSHGN